MTRDGPRGPVNAAAKHVNLKGVRARCACSRHVACNMVGSAPVDDGRGGQSDHSGKRALSPVFATNALQSITSNVFKWTCHHLRSAFRTTMRIKGNFLLLCFHVDSPLMFAKLLKCCVYQRLADQFIFGNNMKTWREGLER